MSIALTSLYAALCIANTDWVDRVNAPRERSAPYDTVATFCIAQAYLHALEQKPEQMHDGKKTKVVCKDMHVNGLEGHGSTANRAHEFVVGQCVVLVCQEYKAGIQLGPEMEDASRNYLYHLGFSDAQIEKIISESRGMKASFDCKDDSQFGLFSTVAAYETCSSRQFRCGEVESNSRMSQSQSWSKK